MADLVIDNLKGLHRTSKGQFPTLASLGATNVPRNIPHPSVFWTLSDSTNFDLPSASQCAVHLKLLEVFFSLRHRVIASSQLNTTFGVVINNKIVYQRKWSSRLRKNVREQHKLKDQTWDSRRREKWRYYLEIAVGRFVTWALGMDTKFALSESGSKNSQTAPLVLPHLPPLDVLLIWHAFLLNPSDYQKYCESNSLKFLPRVLFPWKKIHSAIDSFKLTYKLPKADETWLNETARLEPDLFTYLVNLGASKSSIKEILSRKNTTPTAFLPTVPQLKSLKHLPRQERAFANTLELMATQKAFTASLVENVQRQGKFVDKMHAQLWIRSPGLAGTVRRAVQRYENFIELFQLYPGTMLVPTLDIDLVWHSHQLSAELYAESMKNRCGRFIDHNDKLGQTTLDVSMDRTSELYKIHFGDQYSVCTCWDCEAITTELENYDESHDAAPMDMDEVAARVKEAVQKFRLYELARRAKVA